MYQNFSKRNQRLLFLSFIILWMAFAFIIFPIFGPDQKALGVRILDVRFFYTPDDVYVMMNNLGDAGRTAYLFQALVIDMLYPFVYAVLLSLAISLSSVKLSTGWQFIPILAASADILENSFIAVMLFQYPQRFEVLAWLATLFTMLKWAMVGFSLLVLIILILNRLRMLIKA